MDLGFLSRGGRDEACTIWSCSDEWTASKTSADWRWYSMRPSMNVSSWVTCSTWRLERQKADQDVQTLHHQPQLYPHIIEPSCPTPYSTHSTIHTIGASLLSISAYLSNGKPMVLKSDANYSIAGSFGEKSLANLANSPWYSKIYWI